MVGDYYLTVQAQSFTTYTVTVILEQATTIIKPAYIMLSEGVPQEVLVSNKSRIQYFSFKLNQIDNPTSVYIYIDGIVG